jgi:hypothetical protein
MHPACRPAADLQRQQRRQNQCDENVNGAKAFDANFVRLVA